MPVTPPCALEGCQERGVRRGGHPDKERSLLEGYKRGTRAKKPSGAEALRAVGYFSLSAGLAIREVASRQAPLLLYWSGNESKFARQWKAGERQARQHLLIRLFQESPCWNE